MCGIYKITNLCNGKVYVGQSVDIQSRWRRHKTCTSDYALYRAFRKYGLENFQFDVIEECDVDQLDERETYWINYYDSFFNGYNETLGGGGGCSRLSKENFKMVIELLLQGNLTNIEIAEKAGISDNMVSAINVGRSWRQPDLTYPLRPQRVPAHHCARCGVEITRTAIHCESCARVLSRKADRPSPDELVKLLQDNNGNFSKVGRMFDVTSSAIVKWCKSYGLPWHSGDYKTVKPKGQQTVAIPIEQWTMDGELVATFASINEAEHKTGITHIREASDTNNTSRKTAGGYIWKRLN